MKHAIDALASLAAEEFGARGGAQFISGNLNGELAKVAGLDGVVHFGAWACGEGMGLTGKIAVPSGQVNGN